jgi:hypothetical protein
MQRFEHQTNKNLRQKTAKNYYFICANSKILTFCCSKAQKTYNISTQGALFAQNY